MLGLGLASQRARRSLSHQWNLALDSGRWSPSNRGKLSKSVNQCFCVFLESKVFCDKYGWNGAQNQLCDYWSLSETWVIKKIMKLCFHLRCTNCKYIFPVIDIIPTIENYIQVEKDLPCVYCCHASSIPQGSEVCVHSLCPTRYWQPTQLCVFCVHWHCHYY